MTDTEREIHEVMKELVKDKTDCMIESYKDVLFKTQIEIEQIVGSVTPEEILKRADMFWGMALQRIDREQVQQNQQMQNQQMMPPQNQRDNNAKGESPCAKRTREANEKIAVLEAQVRNSK